MTAGIVRSLRIPPALWSAFERLVRAQGQTPNGALVQLVRERVERESTDVR